MIFIFSCFCFVFFFVCCLKTGMESSTGNKRETSGSKEYFNLPLFVRDLVYEHSFVQDFVLWLTRQGDEFLTGILVKSGERPNRIQPE